MTPNTHVYMHARESTSTDNLFVLVFANILPNRTWIVATMSNDTSESPSETYAKSRETGGLLFEYFNKPGSVPQSAFTSYLNLFEWGWTCTESPAKSLSMALGSAGVEFLHETGLSLDLPRLRDLKWTHTMKTTHEEEGRDVIYHVRYRWCTRR